MVHYITNSMVGEVMNCSKSVNEKLYVGLCGTQFVGSDRYACVITEIISPKAVRVSWMKDIDYKYNMQVDKDGNQYLVDMSLYVELNDDKTKIIPIGKVFKLRKNGRWIQEGDDLWSTGAVHFGEADNYRDPSF